MAISQEVPITTSILQATRGRQAAQGLRLRGEQQQRSNKTGTHTQGP